METTNVNDAKGVLETLASVESERPLFDFEKFSIDNGNNKDFIHNTIDDNINNAANDNNSGSETKVYTQAEQEQQERLKAIGYKNTQDSAMGELALVIGDIIMSRIFGLVLNISGYQCNFKDLQLSPDEKKMLAPIVDRLVKKYISQLTDEKALVIALVGMYGSKVMVIAMLQEPKIHSSMKAKPVNQEQKPEDPNKPKTGRGGKRTGAGRKPNQPLTVAI